jgi:hypothetical protein
MWLPLARLNGDYIQAVIASDVTRFGELLRLGLLMTDEDRVKAKRVTHAMLKIVKFDIAGLEAAGAGR